MCNLENQTVPRPLIIFLPFLIALSIFSSWYLCDWTKGLKLHCADFSWSLKNYLKGSTKLRTCSLPTSLAGSQWLCCYLNFTHLIHSFYHRYLWANMLFSCMFLIQIPAVAWASCIVCGHLLISALYSSALKDFHTNYKEIEVIKSCSHTSECCEMYIIITKMWIKQSQLKWRSVKCLVFKMLQILLTNEAVQ